MKALSTPHEKISNPDFGLLISNLRARVLRGDDPERSAEILGNEKIWKKLPSPQALEWALLAQTAGLLDPALKIMSRINASDPNFVPAWTQRAALLQTLGRNAEAQGLAVLAPKGTPLPDVSFETANDPEHDRSLDAPFAEVQREEKLLRQYMEIFQGRGECFARQWTNTKDRTSGYVPVRRSMTREDIRDHVLGRKTFGLYLMQGPDSVRLGVVDADLVKDFRQGKRTSAQRAAAIRDRDFLLQRLPETAAEAGLSCLSEFSGNKGFHFWFPFDGPAPASKVRHVLGRIANIVSRDLTAFSLEVFPKQDRVSGAGLGNLVKLPLGVHRASGKKSIFLPSVHGDVWARMEAALENIKINPVSVLDGPGPHDPKQGQVLTHPRYEAWSEKYPELALLFERCPALGGILASCRKGRELSLREEKIVYGVLGFLTRSRTVLHHVLQNQPEYNPHLVDFKLSRLRGTPLGCRRIHELLGLSLDYCPFDDPHPYAHPLLHCPQWATTRTSKSERVNNLQDALDHLRASLDMVAGFLPARS